ncbi:UDP-glycosyltransferase UGT5-like [Cochliomyia hominivorax]
MCKITQILTLIILLLNDSVKAYNILAFLPTCSPSHLIVQMAVVQALAERNHNMTIITVLPLKSEWRKYDLNYIKLDHGFIDMEMTINNTKSKNSLGIMNLLTVRQKMSATLEDTLEDPKMLKFIQDPGNQFDLILYGYLFADYFYGLAEHFNCPMALIWPNVPLPSLLQLMGNPIEITYNSVDLLGNNKNKKGFVFRLKNFIIAILDLWLMAREEVYTKKIYSKYFPPDKYANYDKAKQRVAMVLFSHHFSEKPVRPLVPALIEIGGIHINDQPKPLPKDLDDFINSAEHGVIFFSMGTNVKTHHMQEGALEKIFNVFSKLPQKVLWKVDDESQVPGNSSNILYRKWLPQSDILGHSNVKLFFGHGGKGGITEAKFYGVPMVGLPIFGDQPMNMVEVVHKGYGLSIDHDKPLTEEVISETVTEVLNNPKYTDTVKTFSKLYRDRPLRAKDNAVFWLEYLIRYKGAPHMQSPLKIMSFVESANLDVFAFISVILFILFKLIKSVLRLIVKLPYKLVVKKVKSD